MGKCRIKFDSKQLIGTTAEVIMTIILTALGIEPSTVKYIASPFGAFVKGFSKEKDKNALVLMKDAINALKNDDELIIPNDCSFNMKDILDEYFTDDDDEIFIRFMYGKHVKEDIASVLAEKWIEYEKASGEYEDGTLVFDSPELLAEKITDIFDELASKNPSVREKALFFMELEKNRDNGICNDTALYANAFCAPLFLHENELHTHVRLTNLYVKPEFEIENATWNPVESETKSIESFIGGFIAQANETHNPHILIINGDAGTGKSTLVQYLCYHYTRHDELAQHIFNERQLITIRLRNLKGETIKKDGLAAAILEYEHISSLRYFSAIYPKPVIILDGFDELCMIIGMGNENTRTIRDLRSFNSDCIFIITSRQRFIDYVLGLPNSRILIRHFGPKQREEWIDKYTRKCKQVIADDVKHYILSRKTDESIICDTPMTLYMLAKKDVKDLIDNDWALYHRIFYNELSETEYNSMLNQTPTRNSHGIDEIKEVIYRIGEEIAFKMYKVGNSQFFLTDDEISDIVDQLSNQSDELRGNIDKQKIAKHCYSLCCYWSGDKGTGALEFLHNNIRDFFLAEKIYRELNTVIEAGIHHIKNSIVDFLCDKLCELFCYGVPDPAVIDFILLRAKYKCKAEFSNRDFLRTEYDTKLIGCIMYELSKAFCRYIHTWMNNLNVMGNTMEYTRLSDNVGRVLNDILLSTAAIYKCAYDAYGSSGRREYIHWFGFTGDNDGTDYDSNGMPVRQLRMVPNQANVLSSNFTKIFGLSNCNGHIGARGDFSYQILRHINVSYSDFSGACFQGSQLVNCVMKRCNLKSVNFKNAYLVDCDLSYTDLRESEMKNCCLVRTNLRNAILPDGFRSSSNEEQEEHLRTLGADISENIDLHETLNKMGIFVPVYRCEC